MYYAQLSSHRSELAIMIISSGSIADVELKEHTRNTDLRHSLVTYRSWVPLQSKSRSHHITIKSA